MSSRKTFIAFFGGLIGSDLAYRLIEWAQYRALLLVMIVAAALMFLLRDKHELVAEIALPSSGGFAAGGVIKWAVFGLLS